MTPKATPTASVANFPPWAVVEDHLISHKSPNATRLDAVSRATSFVQHKTFEMARAAGEDPGDPEYLKSKEYYALTLPCIKEHAKWCTVLGAR